MANARRGEIDVTIDGKTYCLCLTLGALASLETRLKAQSIADLGTRFSQGGLRADDIIAIVTAGLRGGGAMLTEDEVSALRIDGGLAAWARIVVELLTISFGQGGADTPNP
jgi:hypothetical protein